MNTPWGKSDYKEDIAEGITFYGTPSHGGFKLRSKQNKQMPEYMRNTDGWYEEDCEWSKVATIFPSAFNAKSQIDAQNTLKNWMPDIYEKHFNTILKPGQSHTKDQIIFQETHKNDYIVTSALSVDKNTVKVCARKGGRLPNGQYASNNEKWFLVPDSEYKIPFVIDIDRHTETTAGF